MKTALLLMMRDPRTGIVAQAVVRADMNWQFLHSSDNPDMTHFRPIELMELSIASDDYTTRYIPHPAPQPGIVDRIVAWLRDRADQMRASA
jgi:hypothetical protein